MGGSGMTLVTSSDSIPAGDEFCAFEAVGGDAAFTASTIKGGDDINETLADGKWIYGLYNTLVVTSGTVRAYYL